MLRILLIIIFLIAATAVTIIVLLQEGKSAGLGSMTGSTGGNSYWEQNKKHSLEGKFERWTKITAIIFVLSAFLIMLIPNGKTTNEIVTPAEQQTTTDSAATDSAAQATDEEKADNAASTDETAPTDNATADSAETKDSADSQTASN